MRDSQIDPEFWFIIAEGELIEAFKSLSDNEIGERLSLSDCSVLVKFLENIGSSKTYGILYKRYIESGNPDPFKDKSARFKPVYKNIFQDLHIELPTIEVGLTMPKIIELICSKLDIPTTKTAEGKWKTPYVPLSLHFYTINKAHGRLRAETNLFNRSELPGLRSYATDFRKLAFHIEKSRFEDFKMSLIKFISVNFTEHSFEGYSPTMEDFGETENDINEQEELINLSAQIDQYLPDYKADLTDLIAKFKNIKDRIREKKLEILQKAARTPHIRFIPKFYNNLKTDNKIIQLNDGSITIEESECGECVDY